MSRIETLQSLRLLPPPANELVPLLSTITTFVILKSTAFRDDGEGWASLLQPYETNTLFLVGSFGVYMTMYWGYSLLIHVAEHTIPSLVHFKIQPTKATPWSEVVKMVPLVLFNQVMIGIPLLKLYFQIYSWRLGGGNYDQVKAAALEIPSIGKFITTLIVHVLCTEFWFYTVHRMLHSNRFLYSKVHSLHHTYKDPSCLESVYVHPVEFGLNSFTVFFIGPLVTGAPFIVLWMWLWMVTFLQVHDHSGYWFPFVPKVLMHDYHHQKISCCYGVLGLLDGILKTDGGFPSFVREKETKASFEKDK